MCNCCLSLYKLKLISKLTTGIETNLIIQLPCKIFFGPVMNSILITFVCNYSGQEQDGDNKKFWPRRGKKKYWLSNRLPTSFVFFSKNHFGVKILEPRNELFWKKLIAFNWAWLQSIFFVRDKNSYFSNKRKRAKESDQCAFKWTQPRRK